ncbi:hypothetical protein FACS1894169_12850 [Bacteroidia bacterium]|nr:hypothetical protein FACS1894169_12850 [Bacteroidia bacterium]
MPYYGKDNDDYVNGQGFCCDDTPKTKSFAANDNPELFQYYYHSDHLGSSSLITNLDGEVVQHIEYVPFGEVFIEERNNTWNTPYLFNAKELDEETGLYYYGARYYDPRVSIWLSTDPLQEKYPHISTYTYTFQNPVKYIDPMGMEGKEGDPHDPLVSQFDSRIKIDVDRGVAELNLDNFSMFTRAKIKAMNEDMSNWAGGIGMNITVGSFDWTKVTNFERSELASMDNTVGTVDANYTTRELYIGGKVLRKDGQPNQSYAGWNHASVNGGISKEFAAGAKGMLVVNLINFSFEQYIFWAAVNDRNKLESHTAALLTATKLVDAAAKRGDIPKQFTDKKSLLHIVNYVYQGVESSGYASIGSIGRNILKNRDSYNVIEKKK